MPEKYRVTMAPRRGDSISITVDTLDEAKALAEKLLDANGSGCQISIAARQATPHAVTTLETFHQACRDVIAASRERPDNRALQYGAAYAEAGLKLAHENVCAVQASYIHSNLAYWRGPKAKEVKATLDACAKAWMGR